MTAWPTSIARKDEFKVKTGPNEPGPGQNMHVTGVYFQPLTRSEFCTPCHQVSVHPGIKLEVVWEQYRASPACKKGTQCQDCHMGRVPGLPLGYDCGPVAKVAGKTVNDNRKKSNHTFYGPNYSIAHPGVFPFHLKANRWTIEQWLTFDWRAGWGTKEFEDRVADRQIQVGFPPLWAEADDRLDAREIIDDNLKKLKPKRDIRVQVMENGSHVEGPIFDSPLCRGQDLNLHYIVTNTNEGHNLLTASLGAQPQLWANIVLIGPDGTRLWETGYTDSSGDVANIHSYDVRQGTLPFDWQLFNLQSMFLITGAKGTDREFYVPVNFDIDQLPFIRPGAQPISVLNHPPLIRMESQSLAATGSRRVPYRIPGRAHSAARHVPPVVPHAKPLRADLLHAILRRDGRDGAGDERRDDRYPPDERGVRRPLIVRLATMFQSDQSRCWLPAPLWLALVAAALASGQLIADEHPSEEWTPFPSEAWSPHIASLPAPLTESAANQDSELPTPHSPLPTSAPVFSPPPLDADAPYNCDPPCIDRRAQLSPFSTEDFSADPFYDQPYNECAELGVYGDKYLNPTQRPLIEWGLPLYDTGPVPPPSLDCGATNPSLPRFYLYGDYRAAAAYNDQNGNAKGVIANRLNLEWDLWLTSTERFHMFTGPFQRGNNFQRVEFDNGNTEFFNELDFFNADTDTAFFEGDLGYMLGGWTGKYAQFDLPVTVGLIPLLFQNGVWMEDALVGVATTIPARNSPFLDWSNYDITFFAGFDQVTSPAFEGSNAAANVVGVTTFIEAKGGYIELGYAFLDDTADQGRSYNNVGISYTRRYLNLLSNSMRVIAQRRPKRPGRRPHC